MKCRSCGHEIAENAIVCYRCGAPTTVPAPARQSAVHRPGPRRWVLVVLVLAAGLCAALIVGLARHVL